MEINPVQRSHRQSVAFASQSLHPHGLCNYVIASYYFSQMINFPLESPLGGSSAVASLPAGKMDSVDSLEDELGDDEYWKLPLSNRVVLLPLVLPRALFPQLGLLPLRLLLVEIELQIPHPLVNQDRLAPPLLLHQSCDLPLQELLFMTRPLRYHLTQMIAS